MKKAAAMYPYSPQLLPVVRHFDLLQDRYALRKLYSLPGSGLSSKDASYACNHPSIGWIVSGELVVEDPDWEILIVNMPTDKEPENRKHIYNKMKQVLTVGKSVIYCENSKACVSKKMEVLRNQYTNELLIHTEKAASSGGVLSKMRYSQLDATVILIGGLVENSDTLEVLSGIAAYLCRRQVCPSVITKQPVGKLFGFHSFDSIFFGASQTEAQRIEELKHFFETIEREERPDVILIEAPDAVMKFNEVAPNGFGIQTYMLAQALRIDYFICCVPLDLAVSPLLEALSHNFSVRLGVPIHAVQVSNVIVDSADMLQTHALSYVHTNLDRVQTKIEQETARSLIPLFNVVRNGSESLVQSLGFCSVLLEQTGRV